MNIPDELSVVLAVLSVGLFSVEFAYSQSSETEHTVITPKALSKQQGDRRPEGQYETGFFGRPLTIGGEYEFNPEIRHNLALDNDADVVDQLTRIEQKFELEAFFDAGHNVYFFGEAKLKHRQDVRATGTDENEFSFERGETWFYYHFPRYYFGIQIGRQSFKDKREWWWDSDLDAIRVRYQRSAWSGEIALAKELAGVSKKEGLNPADDDVTRWIGNLQWQWADRQMLEFFWLAQSDKSGTPVSGDLLERADQDESDADLTWLGIRSRGTFKVKPFGRFYYWVDLAQVNGDEKLTDYDGAPDGLRVVDDTIAQSVSGMAVDIGATWRWESDRFGDIYFSGGIAVGGADSNPDDDEDSAFRQTGLQDNNGKFRGVDRFRYYGEAFRPELSNMRILTLSVGKRMLSDSSIEIVYHDYHQLEASTFLRDTRVDVAPTGLGRHLGQEVDLVIGLEEWVHWEFELVAAAFRSGKAFGVASDEVSIASTLKVNYNF